MLELCAGSTSWYFILWTNFFLLQVPLSSSQAIRKEKPPARIQECSFVGCDFTSKVGWGMGLDIILLDADSVSLMLTSDPQKDLYNALKQQQMSSLTRCQYGRRQDNFLA
jgi:hypothetical protein